MRKIRNNKITPMTSPDIGKIAIFYSYTQIKKVSRQFFLTFLNRPTDWLGTLVFVMSRYQINE